MPFNVVGIQLFYFTINLNVLNVLLVFDTLKTLWIGCFVSYAKKVENMDINAAEKIIQNQAVIFEQNFEYLKSIF